MHGHYCNRLSMPLLKLVRPKPSPVETNGVIVPFLAQPGGSWSNCSTAASHCAAGHEVYHKVYCGSAQRSNWHAFKTIDGARPAGSFIRHAIRVALWHLHVPEERQ
eukprot:GHRR01014306.1.p2 GENE.GHRR01014306.1~~GHRR01014306.1.p2  ORF type:complete len:106 (+),score=5.39 GHRR01014306.1:1118-1435(+)